MAPPRTAPTLDDVARLAGVSTATVSRCLNAPEKVIEKTRTKVQSAVDALGYTPNFAARVMAARRTYTIGAIIPTMENAIFARGLQAFQEELRLHGYTLLVSSSAYRPEIEQEQIRTLVGRGADGLLLIGQDRESGVYDYLDQQRVPALIAWTYAEDALCPTVGFDNRSAMEVLAAEVLAQGHRRIGMISALTQGNDRARQRVEGVRHALRQAGLEAGALTLVETTYEVETGAQALDEILSRAPQTTAVICGNDVLAVGALARAREKGLRVPEDLSITGFDDIELARIVTPQLTTVHVPHREMGRKAAQALVKMVEEGENGPSQRLETGLRLRQSLGPAP